MTAYLETLNSYLPALLRQQLAQHPAPLTAPRAQTFPAAFLFADITGFTALTLRLAQKGAEGVEELSRLLNGYFDRLITLITAHGGDILKIAGDGVLMVWPNANEPLATTVLRAAQCALALQAELHNYEPAPGLQIAMRIGLSCGPLTLAQIGGVFGRWEALVTGAPIVQASVAEERCQPGQVIVAPEVWALAQDAMRIELVEKAGKQGLRLLTLAHPPAPRSTPLLPLAPEAETAARAYIPGAILQRLAAGHTGFLAELRRLTVVFVNLPGFDSAQFAQLEAAQTLMQTLQKALYRYEGSVNQFIMDDKGTTLVAALGLPPLAHADDPARGLLAALEVAAGLRTLGQRYAIGVTTGPVYCGERGNAFRREYALLGDAVNMAARLMQAALKTGHADVFCDAATWQAAKGRVDCAALPPITVKGKTEPLPIYRPLHEKTAAVQTQIELVGRTGEKSILSDAVQSLLRGEMQGPVILEGEAGLGKSRLVEEVRRQAEAMGLALFTATGDAVERTTAYHAWRNVLRAGFGLPPTLPEAEQHAKIVARLPDVWRGYAPLLDVVLPLDTPENEITAALEAQARLDKTRDLLEALLQGLCAPRCVVLVLEDAHWFDTASWGLVAAAGRLAQQLPLLIVLTTRPFAATHPPEYIQLREQPHAQTLRLQPLGEAEIAALLRQQLQVAHIGTTLQTLIQQRAEGNPFFATETLWSLREAGLLNQTAEGCDLKPGLARETLTLPDTVQGFILNRVDRLPPGEQMTLKVASVLGRTFSAALVMAVYPLKVGQAEVEQHLTVLQERDFIETSSAGQFAFKHTLTRDAVYHQLLFAQRRALHSAVAAWVEQTEVADLEPHYALLAHHYHQALGQPQDDPALTAKVLDYLEKAGKQAYARLTYPEAVELFSHALALANKLPSALADLVPTLRRMQWLTTFGKAQTNLGQMTAARTSLEQVTQLGGSPVPQNNPALYGAILQEMVVQVWHRLRPAAFSQTTANAQAPAAQVTAEALAWLFLAYVFKGQEIWTLFSALKAVNIAENLKETPPVSSGAYGILRFFCDVIGPKPLSQLYEQLAAQALVATSEPTLQSVNNLLMATSLLVRGEWQKATAETKKALVGLERYATTHQARILLLTSQTYNDYLQGHFAQQLSKLELIGQIGRMGNNVQAQMWEFIGKAITDYTLGQFAALQDRIAAINHFFANGFGAEFEHIHTHSFHIWLALAHEDWPSAEIHAAQMEQIFARSPIPVFGHIVGKTAYTEAPLILWRRANQATDPAKIRRWRAAAQRACRALGWFARLYRIGQPAAHRCWGDYHWLNGDTAKAAKHWHASLQAAEQLSMPHPAAQAHWALARLPGPTAATHRQKAKDILEGLGAGAFFAYLEKLG